MNNNKLSTDFQRLLESQNIETEADLKKFLESMVGKEVPSFPTETLTAKEQAQDLVFEAYDLPNKQGIAKAKEALALDEDCIEAYEYLSSIELYAEKAISLLEKGIEIGRKRFGGKYLEVNKGMFWGIHETRPFMRCLMQYSDCLYLMDEVEESIAVMEELIELNPNDNQGVRDLLLLYLIETREFDKFKKYAKQYDDDTMAFAMFNRALFAFVSEGESKNTLTKLHKALKANKFVAKKLLAKKTIENLPDMHGVGDQTEADYYVYFAQQIWQDTEGALAWLKKNMIIE